ncbi:MAG: hypothetical protein QM820_65285 [Minicystis sp.]
MSSSNHRLIWDNRCLIPAATWYDAARLQRVMWRTTVGGNPGAAYGGEGKRRIPEPGAAPPGR